MSNDRLWLKCIGCGEQRMLAKYRVNSLCWWPTEETMQKFMDDHLECCPNVYRSFLYNHPIFIVTTDTMNEATEEALKAVIHQHADDQEGNTELKPSDIDPVATKTG